MAEYPRNPDYTQLRRAVKALQATSEKYLKDKLGILFSEFDWFQSDLRDIARELLIDLPDANYGEPLHRRTRERIKRFFGLNTEAMKVCQLAFVCENFPPASDYFESALQIQNFESRKMLAYMLGMQTEMCIETLLNLKK